MRKRAKQLNRIIALVVLSAVAVPLLLLHKPDSVSAPVVSLAVASMGLASADTTSKPEPARLATPAPRARVAEAVSPKNSRRVAAPTPSDTIGVKVVDDKDKSVANARVLLVRESRRRKYPAMPTIAKPRDVFASGQTDENGEFLFRDLPKGHWRVWAGRTTTYYYPSELLRIRPGKVGKLARLVLERMPRNQIISGIVLDANGEPLDFPLVRHFINQGEQTERLVARSLAEVGKFAILSDTPIRNGALVAEHRESLLRPAQLEDVGGGETGLVLQLLPMKSVAFEVRSGAKLITESAKLLVEEERFERWTRPRATSRVLTRANGLPISFMLPVRPFRVRIEAPGHTVKVFGPYSPEQVDELITLELTPLSRIMGRVLANGNPAPRTNIRPADLSSWTISDQDGFFELKLPEEEGVVLTAWNSLLGAVRSEPISVPADGVVHVDIEYLRAGSLSGVVRGYPKTRSSEKRLLYLWHNERETLAQVFLEADDSFAIPEILPGTWSVSLVDPFGEQEDIEVLARSGETESSERVEPLPLTVIPVKVELGVETTVTLDFSVKPECSLRGSVKFDVNNEWNQAWWYCAWSVPSDSISLLRIDDRALLSSGALDSDDYSLTAPVPGRYQIKAELDSGDFSPLILIRDLSLQSGDNEWNFENTAGRIRARVTPPLNSEWQHLAFKWNDGAGAHTKGTFDQPANRYEPATAVVPSGRLEIYLYSRGRGLRLLDIVTVAPNQDLELELKRD